MILEIPKYPLDSAKPEEEGTIMEPHNGPEESSFYNWDRHDYSLLVRERAKQRREG